MRQVKKCKKKSRTCNNGRGARDLPEGERDEEKEAVASRESIVLTKETGARFFLDALTTH